MRETRSAVCYVAQVSQLWMMLLILTHDLLRLWNVKHQLQRELVFLRLSSKRSRHVRYLLELRTASKSGETRDASIVVIQNFVF